MKYSLCLICLLFVMKLPAQRHRIYDSLSAIPEVVYTNDQKYREQLPIVQKKFGLIERVAKFEKSGLWQKHVTVDQRVVTGQNPASAAGVGEAMLEELEKLEVS